MIDLGVQFQKKKCSRTECEYEAVFFEDSPYFAGHFPGQSVLPAVAQVESIVLDLSEKIWPELCFLVKVRRLKFFRVIAPREKLNIKMQRTSPFHLSFEITTGGERCSAGELEFKKV